MFGQLLCGHEDLEVTIVGVHNQFELVGVPVNGVYPFLEGDHNRKQFLFKKSHRCVRLG